MTLLGAGLLLLFGVLGVLSVFAVAATMLSSMLSRIEERRLRVPPKDG